MRRSAPANDNGVAAVGETHSDYETHAIGVTPTLSAYGECWRALLDGGVAPRDVGLVARESACAPDPAPPGEHGPARRDGIYDLTYVLHFPLRLARIGFDDDADILVSRGHPLNLLTAASEQGDRTISQAFARVTGTTGGRDVSDVLTDRSVLIWLRFPEPENASGAIETLLRCSAERVLTFSPAIAFDHDR